MKTIKLFIITSLFFFMLADINAQVTNYGTNSGTGGEASSYFGTGTGRLSLGLSNTFIGHTSGYDNTTGNYNTFTGANAGLFNTEGSFNVFNGYKAGYNNTTGSKNIFIGSQAGDNNTTGSDNHFIGAGTGFKNTEGEKNIFIGSNTGYDNTTGVENVFVGYAAGRFSTASKNTFIGHATGYFNTTGADNVYNGYAAGYNNTTGSDNTFMGFASGYKNTIGNKNILIGQAAGYENITGENNVLVGAEAGTNIEGSGNICLGYRAGYDEIGHNKLYIDNNYYNEDNDSLTNAPLIYGDFSTGQLGINTDSIPEDYMLAVKGRVIATEMRVKNSENWSDYVFLSEYDLLSIEDLETFISNEQHLPDVPSAEEVAAQGGSDVGEMNKILLQKVEELTLYIIQLNKKIAGMEKQ